MITTRILQTFFPPKGRRTTHRQPRLNLLPPRHEKLKRTVRDIGFCLLCLPLLPFLIPFIIIDFGGPWLRQHIHDLYLTTARLFTGTVRRVSMRDAIKIAIREVGGSCTGNMEIGQTVFHYDIYMEVEPSDSQDIPCKAAHVMVDMRDGRVHLSEFVPCQHIHACLFNAAPTSSDLAS